MGKADTLYIVIPAYNEEENIEQCVNDWYPVVESHNGAGRSRLLIVNDGSKDRTCEKLRELAESRPLLVPLSKENGGHGSAVLCGYQAAVDRGADWIFQTDSDCQTDPAEFRGFWDAREDQEAVIGYRPDRGDGKDRKFVEGVVCFLLKMIFGIRVRDANAPFRLMRRELVAAYIQRLPKDFNLPNIMLTTYFVYDRHRVLFLPISFRPRRKGRNSMNPKKIIRIGWKAVGDFRRLRRDMKKAEQET